MVVTKKVSDLHW